MVSVRSFAALRMTREGLGTTTGALGMTARALGMGRTVPRCLSTAGVERYPGSGGALARLDLAQQVVGRRVGRIAVGDGLRFTSSRVRTTGLEQEPSIAEPE